MRTVEDYISGRILEDEKTKERMVEAIKKDPEGEKELREQLMGRAEEARKRHKLTTIEKLGELISSANTIAAGPRICLQNHQDCEKPAQAVFLDELAEGLMQVEKAKKVPVEDAIAILQEGKKRGHPHVVSYIAGKPMELCNTCTKCCILWKLEGIGINCIDK